MTGHRIIPTLLIEDELLVKTVNFKNSNYIGDPINAVKIFNDLKVDELIILDINTKKRNWYPNINLLSKMASECFVPLTYGGGINTITQAKKIYEIGFEKISINTKALEDPNFINEMAHYFGSQSVIISIDVKKNLMGNFNIYKKNGRNRVKYDPVKWAIEVEKRGAGEILLTSIDKEGTLSGFEEGITQDICNAVSIPVIANGGCSSIKDIELIVKNSNASAAGVGSMFLYQKKGMGVLINYPEREDSMNWQIKF